MLIVTADDYGRGRLATDAILLCGAARRISAASAMVFMADSARAASLAADSPVEFGLHLNFTEPLSEAAAPGPLGRHHDQVRAFLAQHRLAPILYNPAMRQSFRVLVEAQREEFERLYRRPPAFFNGHHHMHLCSNVILGGLLPRGTCVRNSFTFEAGEKSLFNRVYRRAVSRWIHARHTSTNAFFSIAPINDLGRLDRLVRRSEREDVEVETHPEDAGERAFLMSPSYEELVVGARKGGFGDLSARVAASMQPPDRTSEPHRRR